MHINVKWGVYAAIAALVLSFLTGILLGHTALSVAVVRALIFAALFFGLGIGAWVIINTFIPELLFPENEDAAANIFGPGSTELQDSGSQVYGSRVNITLDDSAPNGAINAALPENNGSDADDVGNISDLVSGAVDPAKEAKWQTGLDEIKENSYTSNGEDTVPPLSSAAESSPFDSGGGFTMNFDNLTMGAGGGVDPFGDSFSLPADSGGAAKKEEVLPERKVAGNTPMELEGDFNPKDIALGIRTVLEADKKG